MEELERAIYTWLASWNDTPKAFVWKATADVILDKVRRRKELAGRHTSFTTISSARVKSPLEVAGGGFSERCVPIRKLAQFPLTHKHVWRSAPGIFRFDLVW